MDCISCKGELPPRMNGPKCYGCTLLEEQFDLFKIRNRDAAYTWAIQKALDLAGDITGVAPGDSFLEVENGELGIRSVTKVKTTIARDVPPELRNNDGQEKETK